MIKGICLGNLFVISFNNENIHYFLWKYFQSVESDLDGGIIKE